MAEPVYVGDTHPILWHLCDDHRLSAPARAALRDVDAGDSLLVIPAVVVAEIMMIVERGNLPIPIFSLKSALRRWRKSGNIRLTPLTPELVIDSERLSAIPDIADRLIVAEARALNAPLITKDPDIVRSNLAPVIW